MIYELRIDGVDHKRQFLTVGDLKKYIAQVEATHGKSLDDHLVHMLDMESNDDGEDFGYASHVEADVMDGTEEDPDHPDYKPIRCLSFLRWPNRGKKP